MRRLREDHGWTQKYVAQKLKMKTSSTYANWEYGLRDPDTDTLANIADLFGVTTDYLLGKTKNPDPLANEKELSDADIKTLGRLKEITERFQMDLHDPKTLDQIDSALDLIKRARGE